VLAASSPDLTETSAPCILSVRCLGRESPHAAPGDLRAGGSQRTFNLLNQYAQGRESHRGAEYESRVDVQEFHHFAIS